MGDTFRILYPIAHKWDDIAALLHISSNEISTIQRDNDGVHACLRQMITLWLSHVSIPPTWQTLADVISVINEEKIASKITQTYKS